MKHRIRNRTNAPWATWITMVALLLCGSAPAFADLEPCDDAEDTVERVLAEVGYDGVENRSESSASEARDETKSDSSKKAKKKKRARAGAPDGPTSDNTDPNADGRPAISDTIQEMQASGAPILSPEPVPMWGGR